MCLFLFLFLLIGNIETRECIRERERDDCHLRHIHHSPTISKARTYKKYSDSIVNEHSNVLSIGKDGKNMYVMRVWGFDIQLTVNKININKKEFVVIYQLNQSLFISEAPYLSHHTPISTDGFYFLNTSPQILHKYTILMMIFLLWPCAPLSISLSLSLALAVSSVRHYEIKRNQTQNFITEKKMAK